MTDAGSRLITQAAYALRVGRSKQYVNKLVKAGRLPLHDGLIDPEEADDLLNLTADPARGPGGLGGDEGVAAGPRPRAVAPAASGPMPGSYAEARAQHERTRAERARLDLAERLGRVVDRGAVETALQDAAQRLVQALALRVSEVAPQLATLTDPNDIAARLDAADRSIMERFANELDRSIRDLAGGGTRTNEPD
ncbi:hypothetical protein [Tistrella mobilis]